MDADVQPTPRPAASEGTRAVLSTRSVSAVLFDWFGTLTPSHDIDLFAQWYAYAAEYDPVHARALALKLRDADVNRWRGARTDSDRGHLSALDHVFTSLAIDTTSAAHLRAMGTYLDSWAPHARVRPDAVAALQSARDLGLRVGVLSTMMWPRRHHEDVFRHEGIDRLVDALIASSELPVATSHDALYGIAADSLGVEVSRCAFVGDRGWDDIYGARRAGMRTIWLQCADHAAAADSRLAPPPGTVAHSLEEAAQVLATWCPPCSSLRGAASEPPQSGMAR